MQLNFNHHQPHEAASSSHNPSLGRNTRRSPQNTTTSSQQLAQHDQQQQRESVNIHSTGENTKRRRQQPPQNGQLSFSRKYRGRRLTNHSSTTSSQNDVAIPSPVTLPKHKYLTKLEKTRIRERMTLSFEGGKLQPGLLNQLCNDYGASRSTIGRMWRNMRTEIKDGQVVDLTRKYTRSISTRAIDLEKVKQRGQFPKSKGTILFEDGSVKHFEDQMSSHPNGLENISMEDEEPLSHVYEKCGARKKHGMQIAKSGAHSPKVLPNSESFGKETTTIEKEPALTKKVENHLHMQLRSQDMNRHNVEDYTMKKSSSSFLEESGTKDSERTTNQLPAITKSNRVDSSSEPFEHPMEDNEEQNQHEGVQHPQQKNKDDKERPLELTEPTPEDEAYSSDQLLKPTSHQHSLQQNEQLKNSQQIKRGRGRPRNPNISPMKDATVPLLNLATTTPQCSDKQSKEVLKEKIAMENVSDPSSSQQKNESPKQEVRLRTRKQTATKKDAVVLSEPHLNEQEGLSNQNNQLGKAGRGRPEESKLTPQEATRSRGRPRKLSKLTGEHLVLPLNLDCEQKVELCELGNHQQSQHQNKKLTRGRDKIQKLGDNVGETLCSLCQNEQNGGCGRASDQHSGSQPRNNSRTQSSVEGETNSTQRKEFVAASHVALEALSARSQVDLKDQIIARRRSPRCFEAKKTLIDSQNHKSHDVQLHDQRKIGRLTPALVPLVSPDKVSVNLKDEVYSKPAGTEQANLPLDGKTHTPVSNNSKDPEHQEESRDHEACEKMEVQLTLPKQMTAKSVPKQVPLSSMRQLRSRVNRQSQVLEGTHTLHNLD